MSINQSVSYFFITREITFQETNEEEKGAFIEATVMELDKASEGPRHNIYKIEEGEEIAKSLVGQPIFYGVDALRRHDNEFVSGNVKDPVGIIKSAKVLGNKIKAIIRIVNSGLIETLKRGTKYLFSVGGIAISETVKKIGDKLVHILHGARCNHLQIVDTNTPVGFPEAKMERLIEINETVMICQDGVCDCGQKPKMRLVDTDEIIEISGKVYGFEIRED
jgi:hypothetical protein